MSGADEPEIRVPLIAEEASIDKVEVVSDRVRVSTSTEARDVVAEDMLETGALRVERVAVERQVDTPPPPREEGDTTVISLVEERLVVEKRLFVIEEVRVTLDRRREHVAVPVTLRATRATIEHPFEPTTRRNPHG
ncbi:DUF2382 domain-containing protein [uncultured Sphingomonas sp.]|uniref:DUF2382 domain-containing protein n=1 Tax=uncultured Sphingomonas sp. TaxID=158754 RepID=UPI0035C951BF